MILLKPKSIKAVAVGICFAATCSGTAFAIPELQLDIVGGVYNSGVQSTIAQSSVFTLQALIDPSLAGRNFYLSAAITPNPGLTPLPNFGSFVINGTTYSSLSGMQYGTPPVDSAVSDLASHGAFPTWYAERSFGAGSATTQAYNVQDGTSGKGLLNLVTFSVDVSGLNPLYAVHFDLYSYDGIRDGNGLKIDYFAPFSHDAESGGHNVPDGGSTIALLGSALVGVSALRRKLLKA